MNKTILFLSLLPLLTLSACGGGGKDSNTQPVASILALESSYTDSEIKLDGSTSSDVDNDTLKYLWTVDSKPDNSDYILENINSAHPIFTTKTPGDYTLSLVVNDGKVDSTKASISFNVIDKESIVTCNNFNPSEITLQTENNTEIQKDDYINTSIKLVDYNNNAVSLNTEIKGRGNSTWGPSKKPYRIKFKKKDAIPVLGMNQNRNWNLLANAFDGTMLRNATALCLGKNFIRNSWTPDYRFANLVLNNQPRGLYLVTEHVSVTDTTINLLNNDEVENDPTADSFFVEMTPSSRLNNEDIFIQTKYGNWFEIKSDLSKNNYIKDQQIQNIKKYMDDFETTIYEGNFDINTGYSKYIDVDSAVDYILLNELVKDNDRFFASTHFYKPKGGKLIFGPIWDYDLSAGDYAANGNESYEGWWVTTRNYPSKLMKDPIFANKIKDRWIVLNKKIPNVLKYIDEEAIRISQSQVNNYQIFNFNPYAINSSTLILGQTYNEQVNYLKNWLTNRANWMNQELK